MPFEIRDEGNYHSARLFGVLDGADLNAMTTEVERLEDAGVLIDRITDLTSLDRVDVGFEEVFAVAQRRAERKSLRRSDRRWSRIAGFSSALRGCSRCSTTTRES